MKNVVVALLCVFIISCGRIETGHVGVRTDFNKTVDPIELSPGWYGALFTSVEEFSIKEIEAYTKIKFRFLFVKFCEKVILELIF